MSLQSLGSISIFFANPLLSLLSGKYLVAHSQSHDKLYIFKTKCQNKSIITTIIIIIITIIITIIIIIVMIRKIIDKAHLLLLLSLLLLLLSIYLALK